jgi:hypothetical protein
MAILIPAGPLGTIVAAAVEPARVAANPQVSWLSCRSVALSSPRAQSLSVSVLVWFRRDRVLSMIAQRAEVGSAARQPSLEPGSKLGCFARPAQPQDWSPPCGDGGDAGGVLHRAADSRDNLPWLTNERCLAAALICFSACASFTVLRIVCADSGALQIYRVPTVPTLSNSTFAWTFGFG